MQVEITLYLKIIKDLARYKLGDLHDSLLIDEFFNLNQLLLLNQRQ